MTNCNKRTRPIEKMLCIWQAYLHSSFGSSSFWCKFDDLCTV